ncbi:protein CLAVATA 3 [Senna tora]|uniref:Protein CLAVATA 3 n=1 Tax=Senna tora TaxID=362788 RepID=A0A834WL06_9FABA|nr:protein CLAVATA 3 [Senna tora]
MASKSILASLIFLALLYLLLIMTHPSAHYKQGLGAKASPLMVAPSRKLVEALYGLKDEKTSTKDDIGRMYGSALRKVPSGPDPLHHNGANPKMKPRTP